MGATAVAHMTGTKPPAVAARGAELVAARRPAALSATARLRGEDEDGALVSYQVLSEPGGGPNDQRRAPRRRTRLRAGKILDRANRFLVDATILDRSCDGLRLRLARDIALRELIHFHDEESDAIYLARVAWRNGLLLGIRRGPHVTATERRRGVLNGRYYAMDESREG
jgi:hypothetical protein